MMKKWRKFASIGLTVAMLCSVVTGGISVLAEENGIADMTLGKINAEMSAVRRII